MVVGERKGWQGGVLDMGAAFGVESSIPQPQLGLGASCISADVGAILILPQKLQQRRLHPPLSSEALEQGVPQAANPSCI